MEIYNGILGQIYRHRMQRFTEHEARIVAAAVEARWSDARISCVLGRPQHSVRSYRRRNGLLKRRGKGLWYALAVMLAGALDSPAIAHDPGEPDAEWYNTLERPDVPGASCCQGQKDCKEVQWRSGPDGYEALADDEWVKVPDNKVLHNKDNPTGMAVMCYSRYDLNGTATTTIYCFIPASET